MSNRLFQGVVHQMREAIDRTIGVIDETMSVIACSDLGRIGEVSDAVNAESFSAQEAFMRDGYTYKPFGSRPRSEYILFVEGTDDQAAKFASLLAVSLSSIKQYYDEKYAERISRTNCAKLFPCQYLPSIHAAPVSRESGAAITPVTFSRRPSPPNRPSSSRPRPPPGCRRIRR